MALQPWETWAQHRAPMGGREVAPLAWPELRGNEKQAIYFGH
jgi:hypothetical protein